HLPQAGCRHRWPQWFHRPDATRRSRPEPGADLPHQRRILFASRQLAAQGMRPFVVAVHTRFGFQREPVRTGFVCPRPLLIIPAMTAAAVMVGGRSGPNAIITTGSKPLTISSTAKDSSAARPMNRRIPPTGALTSVLSASRSRPSRCNGLVIAADSLNML